jgi:hypothetical protein
MGNLPEPPKTAAGCAWPFSLFTRSLNSVMNCILIKATAARKNFEKNEYIYKNI